MEHNQCEDLDCCTDNQEDFSDLYYLAPIAYFTCDVNGLVVRVNQAGLTLLGMKKDRVLKKYFSKYILPEYQSLFSYHKRVALNNNASQIFELKLVQWSDPPRHVQLICKPVNNDHEKNKKLLVCIADITDRNAQEESIHLQRIKTSLIDKMQCMNEQILAISDKQNHSLTIINNYIRGCILRVEAGSYSSSEVLATLKKIAMQSTLLSEYVADNVREIYENVLRYESVDMKKLLKDSLSLLQHETLEFPVALHCEFEENMPTIKLDPHHMQHVILNLCRHAIRLMRETKTNHPKLLLDLRYANKDKIEISIVNNGPVFSEEEADSYFSNKKYAPGSGLTTTLKIIERHGGHLAVQMNIGGGACFKIRLPCVGMIS